jgi:E3 ubiquitin-protein ligase RNF139
LFVSRFWIIFVMLVDVCTYGICSASFEPEILQGSFLTSISVIVIHTLFIVFPVVVIDLLVNVYSMADLSIFLTTSNFVIVIGQAFASLFLFLLYKYDSMRDEIWEHFDDVTFYIRLGCDVLKILINSFTVCFGVYTIFFGSYSFHGILRLYGLCHVHIYLVILHLKAMLYQRRQVVQFIANLPDASKEQIEDNNDVCSICLHDMKSAKITPCNHLYHEMCLRKWLNTKTDCPLCKETITITNRT